MMRRLFLFLLLTLISIQAARANCGNDKLVGQGCADPIAAPAPVITVIGTNTNSAMSSSSSTSAAMAVAETSVAAIGGAGGQGGGGISNSSLVFNSPRYPVSMAYAPPIQATATCAIPLAAGLSFINFGGSFGTAYVDQNCALLEQVRAVAQLGDAETAFEMLCASKSYAAARARQGRPCRQ